MENKKIKKYLWRAEIINNETGEDICELPPIMAADDSQALIMLYELYTFWNNDRYSILVGDCIEIEI